MVTVLLKINHFYKKKIWWQSPTSSISTNRHSLPSHAEFVQVQGVPPTHRTKSGTNVLLACRPERCQSWPNAGKTPHSPSGRKSGTSTSVEVQSG
jgi:hypothetical protein